MRQALGGLLTDEEIDATVERLRKMKNHIDELLEDQVLGTDKQSGSGFTKLLNNRKILGVGNSHVVRQRNKNLLIQPRK